VELAAQDAVVEIGPGLGRLTLPASLLVRRVVALEVDRGLVRWLREQDLGERIEIRHEDALKADLGGIARELGPPVVLLGNLPYRISGRLMGALLGPRNPFRRWGLMLQSEVADRVLAEPGAPDYGPLAVWSRIWVRKQRAVELGPAEFEPRPRVRSTFLVLDPAPDPLRVDDVSTLRRVVRAAFQYRRKGLRAALRHGFPAAEVGLSRAGIDPLRRGETLSEEEFVALANAIATERGLE
jgi:16S rRNA (adenine1518-N6/adenine1519-N6)-dimethyltransferase